MRVGKFEIHLTKFNLHNLCAECIDMFQIMADAKNINLKFIYPPSLNHFIVSDPNRIK